MIELKVARGCKAPRPWAGLAVSPCPWQERCFVEIQDGGQGAECSARAAVQWLLCPCSTSPAEQPQVPWQCPQGECPLLVTPGGWQWESQPQCPQGMCHRAQPQPAGEAGLHCQAPPQHPPYLQDVACCFPGNGNGIPHTSGRVSLHPLRCQPCFPGNPASRSSGRQVLGVPSCLLLCPATCHLTALLEGPCWGGAHGGLGARGRADKCLSCSF